MEHDQKRPHCSAPVPVRRVNRPCSWREPVTACGVISSRSTERLPDALVRLGRGGVCCEGRLVLVGLGQNRQKLLERGKVVPLYGSLDDRLDAMVTRDVGRVDGVHRSPAGYVILRLLAKPLPPACGPPVESGGIDEQIADGLVR